MTIQDLQDELRSQVRARISRGDLTGSELARNAGFPQGHLSNFLNSRRGLSIESMDRLLQALRIGVRDLMGSESVQPRAPSGGGCDAVESVAIVAAEHATRARFRPDQVLGTRIFDTAFLRRLKPRIAVDRRDWLRFVLIKLDHQSADFVLPFSVAATLLVDRHYSSLLPYRRMQPNLYAVNLARRCVPAYVSLCDSCLVLRPYNAHEPVQIIRVTRGRSYADYIVGRICHVDVEL